MLINKGEVRRVGIQVISTQPQDFIIETADYHIQKNDGTVIETGIATIENKKILTLFSAREEGRYYCIFTYRIGPEILKAKIYVEVTQ